MNDEKASVHADRLFSIDARLCGTATARRAKRKLWLVREFLLHGPNEYIRWLRRAARGERKTAVGSGDAAPLVSIVVAVFNPPVDILRDTISSVLCQTSGNWELLFVNASGGSHDLGRSIATMLDETALNDGRVIVISLPSNLGISGNINAGVARASGEIILVLDHDDTLDADAVRKIASSAGENPDADIIYYDEDHLCGTDGTPCKPWLKPRTQSPELLLNACYLMHSAVRRSAFDRIGGLRSEMDGAQDWDLYLRLTAAGARAAHIPSILYHWRQIEGSTSASHDAKPWALDAQDRATAAALFDRAEVVASIARDRFGMPHPTWVPPHASVYVVLFGAHSPERALESIARSSTNAAVTVAEGVCSYPQRASDLASALSLADTDLVLFLDSAAHAVENGWLDELIRWSMLPGVGTTGGCIVDPSGFIRHGGLFRNAGGIESWYRGAPEFCHTPYGSTRCVRNCTGVSLSCLMIRTFILRKLLSRLVGGRAANPEYAICDAVRKERLSVVYTPFAQIETPTDCSPFNALHGGRFQKDGNQLDEFFNDNLDSASQVPRLRQLE